MQTFWETLPLVVRVDRKEPKARNWLSCTKVDCQTANATLYVKVMEAPQLDV